MAPHLSNDTKDRVVHWSTEFTPTSSAVAGRGTLRSRCLNGSTPVKHVMQLRYRAANKGNVDVVHLLIEWGTEVN